MLCQETSKPCHFSQHMAYPMAQEKAKPENAYEGLVKRPIDVAESPNPNATQTDQIRASVPKKQERH
jgi:hypothetical protein